MARHLSLNRCRRLNVEGLEPRQLLAADIAPYLDFGPAPDDGDIVPWGQATNLWVLDSYITDALGSRIDHPAIGTRVFVQAEFATHDLPVSCSFPTECRYDVKFSIDGDPRWSGPLDWGIGVSGTGYWVARLGEWLVTTGYHAVSVELDATSRIAETNEFDNYDSFGFTAVSFLSSYGETQFVTPIDGYPNSDYSIVNYVDLNSGTGPSDYNDYLGGTYTYNGHDAIDYTAANFARTDIGLPIVAAASGVVSNLHDGDFDRNTCPTICNLGSGGNFVTVDHGNGWSTTYFHLRKDSVVVANGDFVTAGSPLGLMGSSGNSTDAHLHFAVRYFGDVVETYVAPPSTYWDSPIQYAGHTPGVLDYGTTDHQPTFAELKERPAEREIFPAIPLSPVHFWVQLHGISTGDQLSFVWKRPNGSTYDTNTFTAGETHYGWHRDQTTLPLLSIPTGEWSVEFRRNGVTLAADAFLVQNTSKDGGFEFDAANYYTTENSGTATLTVKREGPAGATSVRYATATGSAVAGLDYLTQSDTLSFAAGQLEQTISIPIVDDPEDEPLEKLFVTLSEPSTGTFLGGQWLVGVNIIDNDVLAADFNGDFSVDGVDFLVWQEHFGLTRGANHADGDSDRDGDVDGADFLQWQLLFDPNQPRESSRDDAEAVVHRPQLRRVDTSFVYSRQADETRDRRELLVDLAMTQR